MESSARRGKQRAEIPQFPLRPLAWSLALHLLALGGVAGRDVADAAGSSPAGRLHAQLRLPPPESLPTVSPAKAAPLAVPPAPTPSNARDEATPHTVSRPPHQQAASAQAEQSAPAIPSEPVFSGKPAPATPSGELVPQAAARPATVALAAPVEAHGPDAAGLREFRLALAGEARRFRRYPEAARWAGLAGTTEVRVLVEAGGAGRRAELAQSSGHAALDQAALDMLHQAAARAALPESLRGQRFAVLLPVVFEVEE